MSKKLSPKEEEKLVEELIGTDFDAYLNMLSSLKNSRKLLKTPIEKLRKYNIIVQASVFWSSRQAYLKLVQSFLSKKIDGKTLTSKFFKLRGEDMIMTDELCAIIEDDIQPIPDLYYTSKANDFIGAIDHLFFEIDRYDPNIDDSDWNDIVYSESKLRSVIQEKYVPRLQNSCDLNESFFRPTVDRDQLIRRSYLISIMSSLVLVTSLIAH